MERAHEGAVVKRKKEGHRDWAHATTTAAGDHARGGRLRTDESDPGGVRGGDQ